MTCASYIQARFRWRWIVVVALLAALGWQVQAAETRRYRLTLKFSEPAFQWSRNIELGNKFHLILDEAPLGEGYWGFVTGVLHVKSGRMYASLSMSKLRGKSETDGAVFGRLPQAILPVNRTMMIPINSGDFKSCTATFTPAK